jgi:hypothetical protein
MQYDNNNRPDVHSPQKQPTQNTSTSNNPVDSLRGKIKDTNIKDIFKIKESTKNPENVTVGKFIKEEKEKHFKRYQFYYNLAISLALILTLDFLVIIGVRIKELNHLAWIGIYLLIIGIGFAFKSAKNAKEDYTWTEKWYEYKIREKNERRKDEQNKSVV